MLCLGRKGNVFINLFLALPPCYALFNPWEASFVSSFEVTWIDAGSSLCVYAVLDMSLVVGGGLMPLGKQR